MQAFIDEFDESPVSSLEDMIKFNEEHADQCLPPGTVYSCLEELEHDLTRSRTTWAIPAPRFGSQ